MSDYTIVDLVRSEVKDILLDVYTSIPAIVESFDSTAQTANVQVATKTPTLTGENKPNPRIRDVPVVFPAGSDWVIAGPLQAGDSVVLVVPHYGTYDYVSGKKNKVADPKLSTRYDLNDAVAIPGMITEIDKTRKETHKEVFHIAQGDDNVITMAEGTGVTLASGTNTVAVTSDNGLSINAGSSVITVNPDGTITITGTTVNVNATNIGLNGATTVTGGLTVDGIPFGTHTHSYTDDGVPSTTGVPA